MARYPCDVDGQRYPGAQSSLYMSVYADTLRISRLYRVCGPHLQSSIALIDRCLLPIEEVTPLAALRCPDCGMEGGTGYVTATWYDGDEAEKRYGNCCDEHAELVLKALGMTPGSGEDRSNK